MEQAKNNFGMSEMEDELQKLEDALDANEEDELYCVACDKEMRNKKAFAVHRLQKKHIENVEKLKAAMVEEELLNSDDLKDTDDEEEACDETLEEPKEEPVEEVKVKSKKKTKGKKEPENAELDEDVKKAKKKGKGKKSGKKDAEESLQCAVCKVEFGSKNKLFSHLKETGHAVPLK